MKAEVLPAFGTTDCPGLCQAVQGGTVKAPDTHSPRRTNTKPLTRGCSCGAVPVPVTTCRQPRARMRCRSAPAGLGRTGQSFRGAGYQSLWTLHQRLLSSSVRAAALGCGSVIRRNTTRWRSLAMPPLPSRSVTGPTPSRVAVLMWLHVSSLWPCWGQGSRRSPRNTRCCA